MASPSLSELEELVLLSAGLCAGDAYGYAVVERIRRDGGREVSLATVHAALYRLEEKGYVRSHLGGATAERGGRRKRLFTLTHAGIAVLRARHEVRSRMWLGIQQRRTAEGAT